MAGPDVHHLTELTDTPDDADDFYLVHLGTIDRRITYLSLRGLVETKTADYTVGKNSMTLFVSGDVTITLPLASLKWKVRIVNIGTGTVKIVVAVGSSDTIEGYSEINLVGTYEKCELQGDGGVLWARF